jgi:conjugal transfer mating pair stabilization protein TraG
LENNLSENWKRAISDQSGFTSTMSEDVRNQFSLATGLGFKKIASANGQLVVLGNDGESVSFKIDENTSQAFSEAASQVRSESLRQTVQETSGMDYLMKMAKQSGASEAYQWLDEARSMRGATESYGADLTTAFVADYSQNRFGDTSPEHIRATIADFNDLMTNSGRSGVKQMNKMIEGFVSGKGYGWGGTQADVSNTIANTKAHVGRGQLGFKQDVGLKAYESGAKTLNATNKGFDAPKSVSPLDRPNAGDVTARAEEIRDINRREEAGEGGIQTSGSGILKETLGQGNEITAYSLHRFHSHASFYKGSLSNSDRGGSEGITLPSGSVIMPDGTLIPAAVYQRKENN